MAHRATILATLLSGTVINAFEWVFHGKLLNRAWTEAFAALGKTPTGWTTFIPSNFVLAFISVAIYVRIRRTGKPFWRLVATTALTVWIVFWVIPTLALLPLNLFPPWLLWSVIGLGAIDCGIATALMARVYERVR